MSNDRNAGRKPEWIKGTKLKRLQKNVPLEKLNEILISINLICEDYKIKKNG
jgi:hypothetical protein